MEWEGQENTLTLCFYHDGPISASVEQHYSYISQLACTDGMQINKRYLIIRSDYPECIPKREFMIYGRKEPFVDPANDQFSSKEGNVFYRESYSKEQPFPQNKIYSENDKKIIEEFYGYINRALWNEVIPSLRQVSMQWDSEEKIMWIIFYHDGPVTDAIAEHYSFIDSLADC